MSGILPRLPQYAFMALAGTALRHDSHARTDACRYSCTISRVNKLRQHSPILTVKNPLRISDFLCVWTDGQFWRREQAHLCR
jgi:hypothetical protein